ncbi:MAG TPA: T9SS type A sorting domain-containing protein [Bacteroidia bacterium]|jgi:sugar lactone lactonase YvrE
MKKATPTKTIVKNVIPLSTFCLLFFTSVVFAQHAVSTHAGSSQGYTDATGTAAKFKAPTGICISPDGSFLYVADYSGHRIRKINVATKAVTTVAGNGVSGYTDASGSSAVFSYPSGICISGDGSVLYVSDYGNSRIRKIDLSNQAVTTIAGNGNFSYSDNVNGLSASFNSPTDVVNDHDSILYISDTENHLIRKFNISTSEVSTLAGMAGIAGFQNGAGTNAAFRFPKGMAVSSDGLTLYVADNGNNMIRAISLLNKNVTTIAGDGTAGYADNITGAMAKFSAPNGVSITPGDPTTLYVADNGNHRIRKISTLTTQVSTIAGNGAVPPASTFADNATGINARFFYPTNLILSPDAMNIYVADQGNFRVRKIQTDLSTGETNTISSELDCEVFPNPVSGQLSIRFPSGFSADKMEFYDQAGRLVITEDRLTSGNSGLLTKDLSALPVGSYFLKISNGDKIISRKIILFAK